MAKINEKTWSHVIGTVTTVGLWVSISVLAIFIGSTVWAGDPIYTRGDAPAFEEFQINAYGGSAHGTRLKIVSGCPPKNTDCTWTLLPNGMIVSDSDPTLAWNAFGGARPGAEVVLVNNCQPSITDCTWTVRTDGVIVSNTDLSLAVYPAEGFHHRSPLKLVNWTHCAPRCGWQNYSSSWPYPGDGPLFIFTHILGEGDFAATPHGEVQHKAELVVQKNNPLVNNMIWNWRKDGMITSNRSPALAWNAYGGAFVGAKITLVNNCPSNNTDCQWDLRSDGLLVSRTNPKLAVKAVTTPHNYNLAPLVLVDDCTPEFIGCVWKQQYLPQ
ncbi:MAG: hypothetical protein OJF51_001095 [Nitrospira sp.]|nr:MAG: hypothetical protein OJF51_001095 [Nitrospira sp.]